MIDHSAHPHPSTPAARALCRANGGTGFIGKTGAKAETKSAKAGSSSKTTPASGSRAKVTGSTVKTARRSGIGKKLEATDADRAAAQNRNAEQAARLARIEARAKKPIVESKPVSTRQPVKATAKKPEVTWPAATPPTPVVGKDLRTDLDYDKIGRSNPGSKLRGEGWDEQLPQILKAQGFNGKPTVVSSSEMDKLVDDGTVSPAYRAVLSNGDKTAVQINEQMRSGELHAGSGGYGNGVYFAPERGGADAYAAQDRANSDVLRAGIRKDAKVINYFDLVEEMKKESAGFGKEQEKHKLRLAAMREGPAGDDARKKMETLISGMSPEEVVLSDPGRFAAAKGYDAISVGYDPDPFKNVQEYVVLNRTIMVMEERK